MYTIEANKTKFFDELKNSGFSMSEAVAEILLSGSPSVMLSAHTTMLYLDEDTKKIKHGDFSTSPRNIFSILCPGGTYFFGILENEKRICFLRPPASEDDVVEFLDERVALLHDGRSSDGLWHTTFRDQGRYLIAAPNGYAYIASDQEGDWERFAVLSLDTSLWFDRLKDSRWLFGDQARGASFPTLSRYASRLILDFGAGAGYASGHTGPVVHYHHPESPVGEVSLIDEGGTVGPFLPYKPLVYFAVFGDDSHFKCLDLCLESLCIFGKYRGTIAIMTDRSRSEILEFVPDLLKGNVEVIVSGVDERYFARFCVEDKLFDNYSPIVYLDTDILVTREIEPVLRAARVEDRFQVCVQEESNPIRGNWKTFEYAAHGDSQWFGGWLSGSNPTAGDRDFCMINSGTFSFKKVASVRSIFSTTRRISKRINPDMVRVFGDQPALNHVMRATQDFDTSVWRDQVNFLDHLPQFTPNLLQHFAGVPGGSREKVPLMEQLMKRLKDELIESLTR